MIIVLDFDGTVVSHEFPKIGKDIGAVPVLKNLVNKGHQLILFTMRSDIESASSTDSSIIGIGGNYLTLAVQWFVDNDIPLYGIQTNPEQKSWTTSPKAYGHLIIDDAALGIPLLEDKTICSRPFVDWKTVEQLLIKMKIL